MLYSLAKLGEEYYSNKLDRFIALAPCWVNPTDDITIEQVQNYYEASVKAKVYTIGGLEAEDNIKKICSLGNESLCDTYKHHAGYDEKKKTQKYYETHTIQNQYYWF